MRSFNIRDARDNLSKLVAEAAKGESFIIAKAGKPLVTVVAVDATARRKQRRLGFLSGRINVPRNFDRLGAKKIERLFSSKN